MSIWTVVWWVIIAGVVLIPIGTWFYKKVLRTKDGINKYKDERKG